MRRELRHCFRLDGIVSWFASVLIRIIVKTTSDATLIMQFRHPFDLGGAYWSFNLVLNQFLCFVAVFLYTKFGKEIVDSDSTPETDIEPSLSSLAPTSAPVELVQYPLWTFVISLFFLTVLSFLGFLRFINRKYLVTFFDRRTGKQFLCDLWRSTETDKERIYVFSKHRSYYKTIEKEIKEWLSENWDKWEDEKEDWFCSKNLSRIPVDLLPEKIVTKYGGTSGERRSIKKMANLEEKVKRDSMRGKGGVGTVVPKG